jgi:hypothetical protein
MLTPKEAAQMIGVVSPRLAPTMTTFFKGAPSARRARAEPAQRDRELETGVPERKCVRQCEHDHQDLSGVCSGPEASVCRAGALRARHRRRADGPASLGMWLLAVTRSPAPRQADQLRQL